MTNEEITKQLEVIADSDHFVADTYELTDALAAAHGGLETVEPILRFMETHPDIDYGIPGPLVHYMEKFYHNGYEEKLLESIERQPTPHTVWLLNRLINDAKNTAVRQQLLAIMGRVRLNPRTDEDTIREADDFLEYQGGE